MFFKKYDEDIARLKKKNRRLEKEIQSLKDDLRNLEKAIPDTEKEGKPFFAEKRVQTLVYGFIAMILTAAAGGWVAGSGVGGFFGG